MCAVASDFNSERTLSAWNENINLHCGQSWTYQVSGDDQDVNGRSGQTEVHRFNL